MTRYVALIRGINVGATRKLPMAELRAALTAAGFAEVATYIQSGNIVLSSDLDAKALTAGLETLITDGFALNVPVAVRTAEQWRGYASGSPLPVAQAERPKMLHLCIGAGQMPADAAERVQSYARAGEVVVGAADALWVDYAEGAGRSELTPNRLDRAAGQPVTARNWNTVQAVAALL